MLICNNNNNNKHLGMTISSKKPSPLPTPNPIGGSDSRQKNFLQTGVAIDIFPSHLFWFHHILAILSNLLKYLLYF